MSSLTANLSCATKRSSSTLIRYRTSSKATDKSGTQQHDKSSINQAGPQATGPTVSNLTLLKRLKEPIQRSRGLITDLEKLLADHESAQAREEALFKMKLAECDKKEPQRQWYYDQLGITDAKEH